MNKNQSVAIMDVLTKHKAIINMSGLTKKAGLPPNFLNKQFAGQGSKYWFSSTDVKLLSALRELAADIDKIK